MIIKALPFDFSICKAASRAALQSECEFYFTAVTDEEISIVCKTEDVPRVTTAREDGWRAFRIEGELDFSLTGILSKISGILAENKIGIFAVSTFNTDYILVKRENFQNALTLLVKNGYTLEKNS